MMEVLLAAPAHHTLAIQACVETLAALTPMAGRLAEDGDGMDVDDFDGGYAEGIAPAAPRAITRDPRDPQRRFCPQARRARARPLADAASRSRVERARRRLSLGARARDPHTHPHLTYRGLSLPLSRSVAQCGNMWYPREEKATQTLVLRCRNCSYAEPAEERRTYENKLKKEITNKLEQLSADVTQDKTLQRTNEVTCAKCGHNEAVLFQAESGSHAASLSLIFVCTGEGCGHKWVG